jgi:hypothetical protein
LGTARIESADEERRSGAARFSRASLFTRSLAVVGALSGGAVGAVELAASPISRGSPGTDRAILTFGLLIERLQAAFYAEALRAGHLTGEAHQYAQVVGAEEQAHAKYFSDALGTAVGKSPRFHFGDATTSRDKFIATAVSLEEAGLGVYNGQAVNLTPKTLAAAAKVVSVEARHAAWARALAGKDLAPAAVDAPISISEAKKTFQPFIVQ